ncbi:MAG: glutamate 5-kinase [Rhodospirillaceae bacterium]|nr:glutamate 5-kinase [Rhodospirillaceae bacterium]
MSAGSHLSVSHLLTAKRVVVKIGSALLVDDATGELHRAWLEALADDINVCIKRGQEVVIVTSGAIAIGRGPLGMRGRKLRLEEKQAAAATGQMRLTQAYQNALERHGITVAQVLVTIDDTENRRRFLNARSTLDTLLKLKAVPVINENDTVATAEIRFGDNDRLAARVAQMIGADALILLSDIDGLYTGDPRNKPDAAHIPEVRDITPEVEAMAGVAQTGYGSGGMVTKIMAAKICMSAGCRMAIAPGKPMHALQALEKGGRSTWFIPKAEPRAAYKQWIAGAVQTSGVLVVDDGAVKALRDGKSLLPAGVVAVDGTFERGDAVAVKATDGRVLAKGLSAYSAEDVARIKGHKSAEIEALLGYQGRSEVIHRDDLVVEG